MVAEDLRNEEGGLAGRIAAGMRRQDRRVSGARLGYNDEGNKINPSQEGNDHEFRQGPGCARFELPAADIAREKALTDMHSGQVLRIVSTDLGSVKDFQAFCKQTGNELLSQAEAGNEYTFFLKRK